MLVATLVKFLRDKGTKSQTGRGKTIDQAGAMTTYRQDRAKFLIPV